MMNIEAVRETIASEDRACCLLGDVQQAEPVREAAARYLAQHFTPRAIHQLVLALSDNDFGVHWETAALLAELGEAALPELLSALTNPALVANSRMREGAYHVLHYNAALAVLERAAPLLQALKGPAADITTLIEASRWLEELGLPDTTREITHES